jgi:hypothetical protein
VAGLEGREGAFLARSFWLADRLHLKGRERRPSATCPDTHRPIETRGSSSLLVQQQFPNSRWEPRWN